MALDSKQRTDILRAIKKLVLAHHINVAGIDYGAWTERLDGRTAELLATDVAGFEAGVREILTELKTSHTLFYHSLPTELLPQHTINASLRDVSQDGRHRWMFLDVFEDGPAHAAGIRPGDFLDAVDGTPYLPPTTPYFAIGHTHRLLVAKAGSGSPKETEIGVPMRKERDSDRQLWNRRARSTRQLEKTLDCSRSPTFPELPG
jgi:hypothetical protein